MSQQPDEKQSDISNLQASFSKQQKKISALKELVRKSEAAHGESTSSAQEKVKNIAQRLTHLKSKARSRHILDLSQQGAMIPEGDSNRNANEISDASFSLSQSHLSTSQSSTPNPTPQKIQYQRSDSSSSTVSLPATTQSSEKVILLRKQMEEHKAKIAEREHSKKEIEQLVTQLKAKFETTQQCLENSSELGRSMSDLSSLAYAPVSRDRHRSSTDLSTAPFNLDKERIKFLDNRVRLLEKQLEKERQMVGRDRSLIGGVAEDEHSDCGSAKRVKELENKILELEESMKEKTQKEELIANINSHGVEDSCQIENDRLKTELQEKCRRIASLEEMNDILETTKCDLTIKTTDLEEKLQKSQKNCMELEKKLEILNESAALSSNGENQKFEIIYREDIEEARALDTKSDMISQIRQLQEENETLKLENEELKRKLAELQSTKEHMSENESEKKISSFQAIIEKQREDCQKHLEQMKKIDDNLMEKTIELNVLAANFAVLEEKLKEANRAKPLFAAVGTDAGDLLRAQEEILELKRKLQEFNKMSGYEKTETVCVASQMEAIQLEEEVTILKSTIKSLENELKANLKEIERYNQNFIELQAEKDATDKKLEHYIAENIELLDKIEKLSKSSSSAESIEIVERLTQQERAEIDAFNKQLDQEHEEEIMRQQQINEETTETEGHDIPATVSVLTSTGDMGEELSDSLIKLREESSELMNKIELFTTERKEVLGKMEVLTAENQKHIRKIENLLQEKDKLETSSALAENERDKLQSKLDIATKEKDTLSAQIAKLSTEKKIIAQELNALTKAVSSAASDCSATLLEKCEKSLDRLNVELENYRKTNDKNAKFSASKKLSKEAKNAHQQLSELVKQIKETSSVAHSEIPSTIDAENEELNLRCTNLQSNVEDLRRELLEARLASEEKSTEINQLNREIEKLQTISKDFDDLMNSKEMAHEKQIEHLTRLRCELGDKCETYEGEMKILQTLISEQKQQLIDSYKENEFEQSKILKELQERNDIINQLRNELTNAQSNNSNINEQYVADLKTECEKLRESQKISKALLAEQIDDLSNKQETIDTLNSQIMELYKTMEENSNKVIEKEDEVIALQEVIDINKKQMERLSKENIENKAVVDKLLTELHSQKLNLDQLSKLPNLEAENKRLQATVEDLENRNKELLEKLKKYAANLKKRTLQCQELEQHVKNLKENQITKQQEMKEMEKVDQSEKNMQSLEIRLRMAEEALKESRDKIQSMQAIPLESQYNDNRLEDELQNAKQEIHEKNEKLVQVQNELEIYKENKEQLEMAIIMNNNDIEKLKNEINAKTLSLQQAQDALDEVQDELQTLQDEERNRMMAQTKKISQGQELSAVTSEEFTAAGEKNDLYNNLQQELLMLKEQIHERDAQIRELHQESQTKSIKFEKCKAIVKEKNREIQRLTRELAELNQRVIKLPEEETQQITPIAANISYSCDHTDFVSAADHEALQQAHAKIIQEHANEKHNFEETISRLETLHDGIQAKLLVDMNYIESIEQENAMFKEKICKLEECVASFEERRASMERRANLLDEQMQSRTDEYEKTEDALVYRLNMLSNHDEIIAQRLLESQGEKEELAEKLETLKNEHTLLTTKYTKLEKDFAMYREETKTTLETEHDLLREDLAAAHAEMSRMKTSYEAKLISKHTEIDELETELSEQLRKIGLEKRSLMEDLERAQDEISEQRDELCRLKETVNSLEQAKSDLEREMSWVKMQNDNLSQDQFELQELRMQTMQDKTELENLRHQIEVLVQNHEMELNALRMQISELDILRMQVGQNQTDDQVFIETENKRLTDLLAEKESIIENYQRQNLQLQISSMGMPATSGPRIDPFSNNSQTQTTFADESAAMRERCNRLERELVEKSEQAVRATRDLAALQAEFHGLVESNGEMQRHLAEKQREIDHLRSISRPNSEIISAPSLFFASEQISPSPFDEIVNVRHVDHRLEGVNSGLSTNTLPLEQPTIEDLQRNVSDLEKHANDLENKLAMRIVMHEDAQRQLEELLRLSEAKAREYEERMREFQRKQESYEERIQELELKAIEKSLEKQILLPASDEKTDSTAPSLDMFFRGPLPPTAAPFENIFTMKSEVSTEPIVEEKIIPKKSYVCYPSTDVLPDQSLEMGEGWGDSWGYGSAEDTPKFIPNTSTSLITKEQQLEIKLQERDEKIQQLELERERLQVQKQEMQVKSGRLMKKLKEYKNKIDELSSQASFRKSSSIESSSNELDLAIQDELKTQISQLETKLTEVHKTVDAQAVEKDNLLKRIDILMAGNEKLTEMKERQDDDMQMYQSRIRELNQSLKRLEDWASNSELATQKTPETIVAPVSTLTSDKNSSDLEQQISILKAEIDDISGDKLELQAMLDEEKANSERAENIVRSLREKIITLENTASSENAIEKAKLNEMKVQNQNLLERCSDLESSQKQLKSKFEEKSSHLEQCRNELQMISNRNQELILQIQELEKNYKQSREDLEKLIDEHNQCISNQNKQAETNQNNSIEIQRLTAELQSFAAQNQELISQNLKMQSSFQNTIDSAEMETKVKEISQQKDQLQKSLCESMEKISQLEVQISELSSRNEMISARNAENEKRIEELSVETFSLKKELNQKSTSKPDELEMQLQEKDSEILHLKQRIEDLMREDQTEKLVLEILTKNQEIHMLKMQVKNLEDDKQELENNLSIQLTRDMEQRNKSMQQRVDELEKNLCNLQKEKASMEEELQVLNNHVMSSLDMEDKLKAAALEIDAKNIEISELRHSLQSVQSSSSIASQKTEQTEAIIEQKCSEIAQMWREHLQARENEFKINEKKLLDEIDHLRSTGVSIASAPIPSAAGMSSSSSSVSTSATESKNGSPIHHDAEAALCKMQSVLESQEIEIVTLKEQLAIRSAEYARLAAQYDPFKMQTTLSHSGSSVVEAISPHRNFGTAADSNSVTKSELDLALYMLHQRDMRCEELTLELVNLLEERDTLQLKLSNTLRQVEEIKSQTNYIEPSVNESGSVDVEILETSSMATVGSQNFNITAGGSDDELSQKLSQLQTVNHSKDKRFQEEREQRSRQMEKIQQDVAKIPSQAVSELVGSDMSQSHLSPSSVLLNWLWGSSTEN